MKRYLKALWILFMSCFMTQLVLIYFYFREGANKNLWFWIAIALLTLSYVERFAERVKKKYEERHMAEALLKSINGFVDSKNFKL